MQIEVHGKKIGVSVSEYGTFYDTKTKKFTAPTLRALRLKMLAANNPEVGDGIPVTDEEGTPGKVVAFMGRERYKVRWENKKQATEEPIYNLFLPMTPEDAQQIANLKANRELALQAETEAESALNNATTAVDNAEEELDTFVLSRRADKMLRKVFGGK